MPKSNLGPLKDDINEYLIGCKTHGNSNSELTHYVVDGWIAFVLDTDTAFLVPFTLKIVFFDYENHQSAQTEKVSSCLVSDLLPSFYIEFPTPNKHIISIT